MGREYVIQSWVKHDPDDWRVIPDELLDHSVGYSGEQVGNRLARSNGNVRTRTIPGWNPDGTADIAGAAEPERAPRRVNPLYAIDPAFKILEEYEPKVTALTADLEARRITQGTFDLAMKVLDNKLKKAEAKIHKLAEPDEEEEQEEESEPVLFAEVAQSEGFTEEELKKALNKRFFD